MVMSRSEMVSDEKSSRVSKESVMFFLTNLLLPWFQ